MSVKKFHIVIAIFILSVILQLMSAAPIFAEQAVAIADVNFGIAGEQEFLDGYMVFEDVPVYWESDVPWRMTVRSLDLDFGISDDGSYVKPAQDILWRSGDEESWLPVHLDEEEVTYSYEAGSGVLYLDVAVLLDWTKDSPGEYTLELVFSIEPI
ncbi:MAG TPA: hypothetical protein VGB30_02245 [bacterium]|jgi:hypothetical protein